MPTPVEVYLECGTKRSFAVALDWPGWCRHGPSESDALAEMFAYASRYASIIARSRLGFVAPADPSRLVVVERLRGTKTTDFGALSVVPTVDRDRSCDAARLRRFEKILRAGWRAFDAAVGSAHGRTLTTGPRGGGRSLDGIVSHVIGADAGYLTAVGWKPPRAVGPDEQLAATRAAILAALEASATGQIAPHGPRGGVRWTARYFARRVAWHVFAHTWEIERRAGLQHA